LQTLAPFYEKLAEELQRVPSLVVAKMDATANEITHPAVQLESFPAIKVGGL
jgi:protein disulfide-isomerase A1